jgi:hypothetical protein
MNDSNFEINDGVLESYCYDGEVVIPDGVTAIGDSAFWDCKSMEKVIIPYGVTTIGEAAFENCTNLRSVEIPASVTEIGDRAFSCCKKLWSISIPNGVTSIGAYAFSECASLGSIEIPSSVEEIGEGAFNGCYQLVITAPEGSYAAEYIEENKLKPIDLDPLLENLEEVDTDEIDSIRIGYEIDEGYAFSYYYLILKKRGDDIVFIGRNGCNESDEDLDHAEMVENYYDDERDLRLYALLIHEFNNSYENGKPSYYDDTFAAVGYPIRKARITPTMMAIFKEFIDWGDDVLNTTYGVIFERFKEQNEDDLDEEDLDEED